MRARSDPGPRDRCSEGPGRVMKMPHPAVRIGPGLDPRLDADRGLGVAVLLPRRWHTLAALHFRRRAWTTGSPRLFLAVLFGMSLHGLFSMPSAMNYVAPRGVSVVCRLFVMSGIVVLGSLLVVTGSMLKVF